MKLPKRAHAFQVFTSIHNVETLNSYNPELQLKDTEFENKSELTNLLTQIKGFKFVPTLVLVFEKIENEYKTKYDTFYSNSKAEILSMTGTLCLTFAFQSIYTTLL